MERPAAFLGGGASLVRRPLMCSNVDRHQRAPGIRRGIGADAGMADGQDAPSGSGARIDLPGLEPDYRADELRAPPVLARRDDHRTIGRGEADRPDGREGRFGVHDPADRRGLSQAQALSRVEGVLVVRSIHPAASQETFW
jgi:hypothetical protein